MASDAAGNTTAGACMPRPAFFDSAAIFGPWFVGFSIELLLTGFAFEMGMSYFRLHASGDRLGMRILVTTLMVLCAIKSLDSAAMVWHSLITLFGTYVGVTMPSQWYNKLHPFMSAVIIFIAQLFFLLRLNAILKAKRWLLAVIVLFISISVAGHLVISIELFRRLASPAARVAQVPAITGLIGTDLVQCGTFTYVMINSKTGVKRTDTILTRLSYLSFTSAGVPMLIDIGKLIAVVGFGPKSEVFMMFSFIQCKMYIIAVLVTLNFRGSLRNEVFFFTTGSGVVTYPSVQFNERGELVSHVDSSAPQPPATQGTSGRETVSSDGRSGTELRELLDLRSVRGRRSTVNVTVNLARVPRVPEELWSADEREVVDEGTRKGARLDDPVDDADEEVGDDSRGQKRRPSDDG